MKFHVEITVAGKVVATKTVFSDKELLCFVEAYPRDCLVKVSACH